MHVPRGSGYSRGERRCPRRHLHRRAGASSRHGRGTPLGAPRRALSILARGLRARTAEHSPVLRKRALRSARPCRRCGRRSRACRRPRAPSPGRLSLALSAWIGAWQARARDRHVHRHAGARYRRRLAHGTRRAERPRPLRVVAGADVSNEARLRRPQSGLPMLAFTVARVARGGTGRPRAAWRHAGVVGTRAGPIAVRPALAFGEGRMAAIGGCAVSMIVSGGIRCDADAGAAHGRLRGNALSASRQLAGRRLGDGRGSCAGARRGQASPSPPAGSEVAGSCAAVGVVTTGGGGTTTVAGVATAAGQRRLAAPAVASDVRAAVALAHDAARPRRLRRRRARPRATSTRPTLASRPLRRWRVPVPRRRRRCRSRGAGQGRRRAMAWRALRRAPAAIAQRCDGWRQRLPAATAGHSAGAAGAFARRQRRAPRRRRDAAAVGSNCDCARGVGIGVARAEARRRSRRLAAGATRAVGRWVGMYAVLQPVGRPSAEVPCSTRAAPAPVPRPPPARRDRDAGAAARRNLGAGRRARRAAARRSAAAGSAGSRASTTSLRESAARRRERCGVSIASASSCTARAVAGAGGTPNSR